MVKLVAVSDPGRRPESSMCAWPGCYLDIRGQEIRVPFCWQHARKIYIEVRDSIEATRHFMMQQANKVIEAEQQRQGYVYFIQFQQQVKIGFSTQPQVRIASLPHDRVIAVIEGTMRDEKRCHAAFDHLRTVGEWFKAAPDLVKFAESLNSDPD